MTTEQIIRFAESRPFEPFTLLLGNGRELTIMHPEMATIGQAGLILYVMHPNRQIEVVDTALIVSVRTVYAADPDSWIR